MISSITLPQLPPFDGEQITVEGLNRVCFFFGANGSGKTTISQLIADEASGTSSGSLHWDGAQPLRTYVYNRRFIAANFENKESVPGVFTMGKGMVDAQKKIDELTEAIEKDLGKKSNAEGNLAQAQAELVGIETDIRDACWEARAAIPDALKRHMSGSNTKDRFRDNLLPRIRTLKESDEKPDIADIESRAAVVFDDSVTAAANLPNVDLQTLLDRETAGIFQKAIVGKEDIPIGALITRLGISDWVETGRGYIEDDVCPFCQQHTLTDKLKGELEDFFDETYQSDKDELQTARDSYETYADGLIDTLSRIMEMHVGFIDVPAMQAQLALLKANVTSNKALLSQKHSEPSRSIRLTSAKSICDAIDTLLKAASAAIVRHNDMIRNRDKQRNEIVSELWTLAAMTAQPRVKDLQKKEAAAKSKVKGLEDSIKEIERRIKHNGAERSKAESSLTNVKETADAINDLLVRFGFEGFKIAVADDSKSYRIVRLDGTPVEDTLSEGEASFLTFLYFYYLMDGSLETTGTAEKRLVVIDDPITSMDADVLFVASALVRQLAAEAREGTGKTEQLIVLTHNITFHREITYIRKDGGDAKTSYYVVRKSDGHSIIEPYHKNPVSSTYELLWKDLYRDDCSPLTAQNVSRRIVETFFRLVGGIEPADVISTMEAPDREIARSFMSWAHSGSHSPIDDETFVNTNATTDIYKRVLGLVFENAGYKEHFEKMTARFSNNANSA